MADQDNSWHLDKRVPIAMISAIAIQCFVWVFWMGEMSQRINTIEARQNLNEERVVRQAHEARIAVLEAQGRALDLRLERIENRLERIANAVGARPSEPSQP